MKTKSIFVTALRYIALLLLLNGPASAGGIDCKKLQLDSQEIGQQNFLGLTVGNVQVETRCIAYSIQPGFTLEFNSCSDAAFSVTIKGNDTSCAKTVTPVLGGNLKITSMTIGNDKRLLWVGASNRHQLSPFINPPIFSPCPFNSSMRPTRCRVASPQ